MLNLGTDEIIKYPFLAEAKAYLKDKGFTLEQFVNDPDHKFIIDIAYDRIKYAANGEIYPSIYKNNINKSSLLPREIFSFIIAVVLLKMSHANILIKKFALSEARRAEKYLEKDLEAKIDIHSDNIREQLEYKVNQQELAIKIIKELFSVDIHKNHDDHFIITVPDYLRHAIHFHELEWKLVNRYVHHGFVFLTPHETVRLLRRKIDQYISSRIHSVEVTSIKHSLQNYINNIIVMAQKFVVPASTSTEYPPCIKHALDVLKNGKNLSHSGRFLLATFLLGHNKSITEIVSLFKNAPDYNERTTLYQINHLAGLSGSRTKYNCPSCQKIKIHNLCFATSECNNITNPFQFKSNNEPR